VQVAGRNHADKAAAIGLYITRTDGYIRRMTKLLERALEEVRRLPSEAQDEIACAMLTLAAAGSQPEEIDAAHLPAVLEGLAQARRGYLASDAEVEAAFRRFDR